MPDSGEIYQMKGIIGQGHFGDVYLLEDPNGDKRALQLIPIDSKKSDRALQEIALLSKLDHPHILKYIRGIPDGSRLCLVTEVCSNVDIDSYLKTNKGTKLEEQILLTWVKQITEALEFLHAKNIVHRDLKTTNVFLDEKWDTKLGDFGISRILSSIIGLSHTRTYMRPQTDIYSLGIMMLAMGSMENVVKDNFKATRSKPPSLPKGYSDKALDLMTKMLITDPNKRPSAVALLQHPALTSLKPSKPKQKSPDLKLVKEDTSFDWSKLQGVFTALSRSKYTTKTEEVSQGLPNMAEEIAENPIMSVVERTLAHMNINVSATNFKERQAEMLKMYCLKCLDNDEELFSRCSEILDTTSSEEDIEEALTTLLGHEKFALCRIQLLYYKNFTFLMRQ